MAIKIDFNNVFGVGSMPAPADLYESTGVNMADDAYMANLMRGLDLWDAPTVHTATRFETGTSPNDVSLLKFTGTFQYGPGSSIPLTTSKVTGITEFPGFGEFKYAITGLPSLSFNYNTFDVWTKFQSVMNQGFAADGTPAKDTLVGGTGHDTLRGMAGDDVLLGGAGNDRLEGGSAGEGFPVNLYSDSLYGEDGNDVLIGGNGDAIDRLYGGAGNDHLDAGSGTSSGEYMEGGTGNDTYIAHTTGGNFIHENPGEGWDTVIWKGYWGQVVGSSVPGVWSYYQIPGNVEVFIVQSNAGEQVLAGDGKFSIKLLIGGGGADNLQGGSIGTEIRGGGGNDDLFGGSGGSSGADRLDGGTGADRMAGWIGNDTYVVDNPGDLLNDTDGIETVLSYISFTLPQSTALGLAAANAWLNSVTTSSGEFENLTLLGTKAINGTGNGLDNVLTGNPGNNVLNGLGGEDTLEGLGGNDTLNGGDDNDLLKGGLNSDQLQGGNGDDDLRGGNGNDSLLGGAGNDRLDGGPGTDSLKGAGGDDTYVLTLPADTVTELADGGHDTVEVTPGAGATFVLPAEVEVLRLMGSAAANGTGNASDNILYGNSAANVLKGAVGNDYLDGGNGNDSLTGGGGNDIFVFDNVLNSTNVDTVIGFITGADQIQLDTTIFAGLLGAGDLSGRFASGTNGNLMDGDDRIFYNTSSGKLFYDADGSGSGFALIQFAVLSGAPDLDAADFLIVS